MPRLLIIHASVGTGHERAALALAAAYARKSGGQARVVDDLVAASDLAITKPGGLIVSEVLARGTPLLLVDPIPGQEEWNADYVVSAGAGVQLRHSELAPYVVQRLLAYPECLAVLRAGAQAAGRAIVEAIIDDVQEAPRLVSRYAAI